jgi:hypothetical protein
LRSSRMAPFRRPLFLHDHKPLAIKTAIPKFEENFNPDKHYDLLELRNGCLDG